MCTTTWQIDQENIFLGLEIYTICLSKSDTWTGRAKLKNINQVRAPPIITDIGTHVTLWVGKYGFEFR